MVARALIVHVTEGPLNRIGFRTVRRQPDKLKARMIGKPLNHCLRLVNPVVIRYHINLLDLRCRVGTPYRHQQVDEQPTVLSLTGDMQNLSTQKVQGSSQIMLLVRPWREHLSWRPLEHPFVADLRQQMDVQFISEEQHLRGAQMLDHMANPRQFLNSLRIVIFGGMTRSLPGIAQLMKRAAHCLARDPGAAWRRQLQGERGATPARPAPAKALWCALQERDQRTLPTEQLGCLRRVPMSLGPAGHELPAPVERQLCGRRSTESRTGKPQSRKACVPLRRATKCGAPTRSHNVLGATRATCALVLLWGCQVSFSVAQAVLLRSSVC